MAITWIKKSEQTGTATLSSNYVVINQQFANKFSSSYSALVGIDERKNLFIKPLSLDESSSPLYKDSLLLKINVFSTFVRLGNTSSMKVISELIDFPLDKSGTKFDTYWDKEVNSLVVKTGGN